MVAAVHVVLMHWKEEMQCNYLAKRHTADFDRRIVMWGAETKCAKGWEA